MFRDPRASDFARLDLLDGRGQVQLGERKLLLEARDMHGRADTVNPAGYAIRDGERDVGAVQTANGGAAWIAADLDAQSRGVVAAASAALLLYRQ